MFPFLIAKTYIWRSNYANHASSQIFGINPKIQGTRKIATSSSWYTGFTVGYENKKVKCQLLGFERIIRLCSQFLPQLFIF